MSSRVIRNKKTCLSFARLVFTPFFIFFSLFYSVAAYPTSDVLAPELAFKFRATEQPGAIELHFSIADGYILYREPFAFTVARGKAILGKPILPKGQIQFDDFFQKNVETYQGELKVLLPVTRAEGPFDLVVTSQGCEVEQGVCYPPIEHRVQVQGAALQPSARAFFSGLPGVASRSPYYSYCLRARSLGNFPEKCSNLLSSSQAAAQSDRQPPRGITRFYHPLNNVQALLKERSGLIALPVFVLLGIALSLLPCSLPMIPVLSALIVGEGAALNRRRGLLLSLTYVLGMAVVYTVLGIAAALTGYSLGLWLQNPWMLGAVALLLSTFALSLFGCFELTLPPRWLGYVNTLQQRLPGGKYLAVFMMGMLSALAVGACMSAPLFGILTFIAQTGSVAFGSAALFLMTLGMGVPLLIVGAGAGVLLPRAGRWMDAVKRAFGLLLGIVAVDLIFPQLPEIAMLLAAFYLVCAASMLHLFESRPGDSIELSLRTRAWRNVSKSGAVLLTVWAMALVFGVAAGSRDLRYPLSLFGTRLNNSPEQPSGLVFKPIQTVDELTQVLKSSQRPVLLDFYADWCLSCRKMESTTLSDARVQARLAQWTLLRVDVTDNHANHRALLKHFRVYGPPAILFFDIQGNEMFALRVVGYQSSDVFLKSLETALEQSRT